jgi:nitroimidazol reductase NimA-like FMN-containing flavoprotein (pyridoxamine 5'-phosphate oxidase superfamily)
MCGRGQDRRTAPAVPAGCGMGLFEKIFSGFSLQIKPCTASLSGISNVFYLQDKRHTVNSYGVIMDPVKIPKMPKTEYDSLIKRQCVSRIAFGACEHPYIAPFMYVFDGKYLYFLSTKYGRKIEYFKSNPKVSVEIEEYAPDLSAFTFVSLQGDLEEVKNPLQKKKVREQFVAMIVKNRLSPRVLTALGHSPNDSPDVIVREERSLVWKLVGVKDIVALKNG